MELGTFLWLCVLLIGCAPLYIRPRKPKSKPGARSSTGVSGNPARLTTMTGPKWEQDYPFPECFDEGDDLDG